MKLKWNLFKNLKTFFTLGFLFKKRHPSVSPSFLVQLSGSLQKMKKPLEKGRLFFKKRRVFFISCILAFLFADLLLLESYKFLLPEKEIPPLKPFVSFQPEEEKDYKILWKENIFHTGPIPITLETGKEKIAGDPVKSSLPFKLKGTIVHANPARSVATVQGQKGKSLSYKIGDTIEKQAKVTLIERGKIVFFNQNNNQLEYVSLPEDDKLKISYEKQASDVPLEDVLVRQKSPGNFEVKRSDLEDYLENLPQILRKAKMIPHFVRRDGEMEIEGFRFSSIDKDSVYEKLGFQKGDIIKQVDGVPVNSPETALELFEKSRGSTRLEILVNRDGKDIKYEYSVSEDAPIRM